MVKIPDDPFSGLVLDEEEQAIEDTLEEYESIPDLESSKSLIEDASRRYKQLNNTRPITLRVKQADLIKIKAKAKRNNIPYQTLLSLAIHDVAEGKKDLVIK